MRPPLLAVAVVTSASACAAPPMGLGLGATRPGGPGTSGAVFTGATGVAASGTRSTFQAEMAASYQRRGNSSGVGVDVGMIYTQLSEELEGGGEAFASGGFPYVRPRVMFGPVSLAVALAGFGMGAGGGGIIGGIADAQLGYGTRTWSVYAGAYSQVFDVTGGDRSVAKQARAGAEYLMAAGALQLGLAVELYAHEDALVDRMSRDDGGGYSERVDSRFLGAGLKLRILSGLVR